MAERCGSMTLARLRSEVVGLEPWPKRQRECQVVEETWREVIAPAAELLLTQSHALAGAAAQLC